MAILTTVNWLSAQRADISDIRRVESAVRSDFDTEITSVFTGTSQGYIVRGFSIATAGTIGTAANNLQMIVDPGAVLHIAASVSGTIFQTPIGTENQVLNSATNTNVSGSFTASSPNYVGIDYNRFADPTTDVTKYIWNSSANDDIATIAPAAQTLTYKIYITTSTWAANVLPVAIVTTDPNGNVTSITDARWMLYSLETGGLNPNPSYVYPWSDGRTQPPVTVSAANSSQTPFIGGDKQLASFKDWANAVMTTFLEIKGTPQWFNGSGSGPIAPSITSLFQDLGNTVITGSGEVSNGILPDSVPVLVATGNIAANSNQITSLSSVAGLAIGDFIFGTGIRQGSTITNITGSTVTMSKVAAFDGTGIGVSFYSPSAITAPGQINWDKDIDIRVIGSSLSYVLAANPTSTDISLADDEVAYLSLVRDRAITPNLIFNSASTTVTSVGSVSWTASLLPGDYIKVATDTYSGYYKIAPSGIVNSFTVTLTTPVTGADDYPSGVKAQYAFGNYYASATPSGDPRAIQLADREDVPTSGNTFWLFIREDNGGSPRVYIRFLSQELDDGQSVEVSGTTSLELLEYIGSPSASASSPQYVASLYPGSVPEITNVTIGSAATISSNQYFDLYSSSNYRRYYVWFNKNGTGVDPMPSGFNDSIVVAISTGQTSTQVATALANALNSAPAGDFSVTSGTGTAVITNTSAGVTNSAVNFNVGAPFAVSVAQAGTGVGDFVIREGESLTLSIKRLDGAIGAAIALYDETIDIVASGGHSPINTPANPPVSINGPVVATSIIALPNNSRLADAPQTYIVGNGNLEMFLNGVHLRLGDGWSEVGSFGSSSGTIEILVDLVIGDYLEFIIDPIGGGGGGGMGPPGPAGPSGPPGTDALNGPITISTKTSSYPVAFTDKFLLGDCTSGPLTFTLPTAASSISVVFYFKKKDSSANAMTIKAAGSELIDGFNTIATTVQYEEFAVVSDGTQWYLF